MFNQCRLALAQIEDGEELVITYNGKGRNQAKRNYATTKRQAFGLVERGDQEVPTVFTQPKIRSVYKSYLSSLAYAG